MSVTAYPTPGVSPYKNTKGAMLLICCIIFYHQNMVLGSRMHNYGPKLEAWTLVCWAPCEAGRNGLPSPVGLFMTSVGTSNPGWDRNRRNQVIQTQQPSKVKKRTYTNHNRKEATRNHNHNCNHNYNPTNSSTPLQEPLLALQSGAPTAASGRPIWRSSHTKQRPHGATIVQ